MTVNARRLAVAAILAMVSTAASTDAEDRDPRALVLPAALSGEWQGTLEYRDYRSDGRVTLPTTLEARPTEEGRATSLKFRYDEGRGRFVEGLDTLRIDPAKASLAWESDGGKSKAEYALAGLDAFAEKRRGALVLTGTNEENGAKVEVRQTITLEGENLTILRESRKPGEAFAFRNTYKLKRVPAKAS